MVGKLCCCLMVVYAAVAMEAVGQNSPAGTLPDNGRALRRTPVVEVFENCREAVVNIASTQIVEQRGLPGIGDLFGGLFDLGVPDPTVRRLELTSVGSGFVIHPSGYIVTNAHVVAQTVERKAIFSDQREYEAQIIAIDHEHDLAVLKIEAERPLRPLRLGRSGDLMVGETVVAIGNPMGYQHTCTAGVVSALNRTLRIDQHIVFKGLIQTDASINPGNSGGPLLNILGQLIGINTAIRGDAQNIGFAIPVDQLRGLLPDMLSPEQRNRVIIGMRLSPDGQAKVLAVDQGSPADRAGVRVGDVLLELDGQPIAAGLDYHIAMLSRKAGDVVRLRVQRESGAVELAITLAARPRPDGGALLAGKFGITAEPISAKTARSLGMRTTGALVITRVEGDSPAAAVGLERGDILVQIGRHLVGNLDEVGLLLESVGPGDGVMVTIRRITGRRILQATTVLRAR